MDGRSDLDELRVLEIGTLTLFKPVYPESTTWLCPAPMPEKRGCADPPPPFVGWNEFTKIKQRLLSGAYDLVVYLVPGVLRRFSRWWWKDFIRERLCHHQAVKTLLREVRGMPIAVLDMGDAGPLNPANIPLLDCCRAYFKRELPAEPAELLSAPGAAATINASHNSASATSRLAKLRTISVGLCRERIAAAPATTLEKKVGVFFAGCVRNLAIRRRGLSCLLSLRKKGVVVDVAEGLPIEEYMKRCAQAWLVWSPEGLGRDCFRHYEAPLCRSVPVINQAPVVRHRPLINGTHCFYYEDQGNDLARVILGALSDKARPIQMAEQARAHVLEHHTHEALCRYITEEIL